jgi:hypothetical protein
MVQDCSHQISGIPFHHRQRKISFFPWMVAPTTIWLCSQPSMSVAGQSPAIIELAIPPGLFGSDETELDVWIRPLPAECL